MKNKYSKAGGIILCVIATLLLLLLILVRDFGIGYFVVIAFCYFVGVRNIRGARKAADQPVADPVVVTSKLTVTPRPKSSANTRIYSYSVYGVRYENEDGKDIQKLLAKLPKEEVDASDLYDGMTNADIKESFDEDDRVYIFEGIEFDADLVPCEFEGSPAVKVYFVSGDGEREHIGWISKQDAPTVADMIKKHECSYSLQVEKGAYKHLEYDADADKYKVVTESDSEYFAEVFIIYKVEDAAE